MDTEPVGKSLHANNLEDIAHQIETLPKREYSQQEIDETRAKLTLMNDRVFLVTFAGDKNNHIVTEIVNALRKIHSLADIPPIGHTTVQNVSLLDVFARGMVGDLYGEAAGLNLTIEVQKGKQEDYAVRAILTSSNVMRANFKISDEFADAPDVIGVNIVGFSLPELEHRKMFCSRIVRTEYESGEVFLADKYSDYFVELSKVADWTKETLPPEYHDIWELSCIFKAKISEYEEVIRMQSISNPTALELSGKVREAVLPGSFVSEVLNREGILKQLHDYVTLRENKSKIEGEIKGKTEGKTEGETEGKIRALEFAYCHAVKHGASAEYLEQYAADFGISEERAAKLYEMTLEQEARPSEDCNMEQTDR